MKKKLKYPAQFIKDEISGYTVIFPDLKGCITEGDSLEHSKLMAQEALGVYLDSLLDDNEELPKASELKGDNIFYIETELGLSTSYTDYHKKSYEKNKESILAKKSQNLKAKKKEGYKDFKTLLPIEILEHLDALVKKTNSKNRADYLINLVEKEYTNLTI
jgi:predicted RNase H-like HicB family nuclease